MLRVVRFPPACVQRRLVPTTLFAPPTRRCLMPAVQQGDLGLLQHPAAQELLQSRIPARLAYVWTDGTPRVVPIWFHWNGRDIVMATPPKAPKLKALGKNRKVSITIDDNTFPHKVLLIRGTARLEPCNGIVPEYGPPPSVTSALNKERPGSSSCSPWFLRWCASPSRRSGSACSTSKPASPARWRADFLPVSRLLRRRLALLPSCRGY